MKNRFLFKFRVFFIFIFVFGSLNLKGQTVFPNYVDGEIYVKILDTSFNFLPLYTQGDSVNSYPLSLQQIITSYNVTKIKLAFMPRNAIRTDRIFKIHFNDINDIQNIINDFIAYTDIEYAEKVPLYTTNCTNEVANFWNVGNPQNYHLNQINACNAFSLLNSVNPTVRVAVVDNEFNVNHPDLAVQFNTAFSWDVSDNDNDVSGPPSYNHGTHCAGIVAARNNNSIGIASLGGGSITIPQPIELIGIKVTRSNNESGNIIDNGYDGIHRAALNGARIISCSWGTQTGFPNTPMAIAEQDALEITLSQFPDIILVCAAGNSNTSNFAYPAAANINNTTNITPANLDRIISVGSVDAFNNKSIFSNFGNWVKIVAPGTQIYSTIPNAGYNFLSGTSMATPMVASLLGLVAYNNPSMSTQNIINCVLNSATNIDNLNINFIGQLGSGLINAFDALNCTPSNNISYTLSDATFCLNNPQNINFNLTNLPVGVTLINTNWSLVGSNLGTANTQNLAGLSYSNTGIFPVQITCSLSNNTTINFNTNFVVLGNVDIIPFATNPVCDNSVQQITLQADDYGLTFFMFANVSGLAPINQLFTGSNLFSHHFLASNNPTVEINSLNYGFVNQNLNIVCPIQEIYQYNTFCCENNNLTNGDFSLGNSGFFCANFFNTLPPSNPGKYYVQPLTLTLPNNNYSGGLSLHYDGIYNFSNFINNLPPSGPLNQINFIPQAPIDQRMHIQNNLTSIIWSQNTNILQNHSYKFRILHSNGNSPQYLDFNVRVRVSDGTINFYTSPTYTLPTTNSDLNQYEIEIPNFVGLSGNYQLILEQIDNYGDYSFDADIDDIELRPIFPIIITSPIGQNCLIQGNTTTLTAVPPTSGVLNYTWTGPAGGIIGANNTQTINVQLPGVYTVTCTNASPLASNCTILTATYTVNGTHINIQQTTFCVFPTDIVVNIISTTANSFTYSLNGGTPQASNVFTNINSAGIYTVVVTDDNNCTGSTTLNVLPAPSITINPTNASICLGDAVNLSASGALTYLWQPAIGLNSTNIANPIASPNVTTTYTVTGTDANGCTGTSSITINVNPLPTVVANALVNPICSGSPATLFGSGVNSYNWSGGVFDNIPFVPITTNTYTVTGTDANGCSNTSSITLTVNPIPVVTASATPPLICVGASTSLSATGALSYVWQPGGIVGSNINVSPASTTVYTITGTDANGCTGTSTVQVTVVPVSLVCCNPAIIPASIFTNSTASAIIAQYGNPVSTNNFIPIEGTLTIDQNITFLTCPNIVFGPDAEIIVNANTTLRIDDNSELRSGCNAMWKGIVANTPNSKIEAFSCTIKNMSKGIRINNNGQLFTNGVGLYDNNISIELDALAANNPTNITGCAFETQSPFLLPPNSGFTKGAHGIKIINCKDRTIGVNTFTSLYNGIYILNSDASLGNSTITTSGNIFKNIKANHELWSPNSYGDPVHLNPNSCAIFALNNTTNPLFLIHHGNPLPSFPIDFEDCEKAILTNNFNTDIKLNNLLNCDAGFMLYRCENNNIFAIGNTISNTYLGILQNGNPNFGGIAGNTITVKQAPVSSLPYNFYTRGIKLSFNSTFSNTGTQANSNTISTTANERVIGIDIVNGPTGCYYDDNDISFNATTPYTGTYLLPNLIGVNVSNSKNMMFINNTINALNSNINTPLVPQNRTVGFYLNRTNKIHYLCNKMDYLQYGMYVVAKNYNDYNQIGNNRFAASKAGILYRHLSTEGTLGDIGTYIPVPYLKYDGNNKFALLNGAAQLGKIHRITGACGTATTDGIFTDAINLDVLDPMASTVTGNIVCRYNVNNNTFTPSETYDCGVSDIPGSKPPGVNDVDEAEDVAQDSVLYTQYPEGGEMMDERELYFELIYDTATRLSRPILNQFYNSHYQSAMAKLLEIDRLLGMLSDSLMDKNSVQYSNTLSAAIALNNQVVSNEPFESNERWINNLYLAMRSPLWDSFSVAERDAILILAQDCPYLGGLGVYKARALADLFTPGVHYDDLYICNNLGVYKGTNPFDEENKALEQGIVQKEKIPNSTNGLYSIYPNPNNGILHIDYIGEGNSNAMFEVYDLLGKKIMEKQLAGMYNTLALPNIANGVYTYAIINAIGEKHIGKLVIER